PLYVAAALSPDKLATTLARLFALLGPGRVGSPRAVDGHRPERFGLVDYAPPPPPPVRQAPRTGRGLLAVRVLRPPLALEVMTGGIGGIGGVEGTEEPSPPSPGEVRTPVNGETAQRAPSEGRGEGAGGAWG